MPGNLVFDKPPLSVTEMVTKFEKRGLTVQDHRKAEQVLKFVSYYRFTGYGLTFQEVDAQGKRIHTFRAGATFDDILERYDFDRHLRLLINDAIERIEVGIRTLMTHQLSLNYHSHWYLDREFLNQPMNTET